jgi:hypothetical protein
MNGTMVKAAAQAIKRRLSDAVTLPGWAAPRPVLSPVPVPVEERRYR